MNLINPLFSFIQFKTGADDGSLLDTEDSLHLQAEDASFIVLEDGSLQQSDSIFISIPISEEDDLKFQVVIETATKEEADALTDVKIYLVNAGAVIIDAASLAGTILADYSDPASYNLLPVLVRIAEKRVLVYWPHGVPDFKTKVNPYTCAKLALTFTDGDMQYYTSNKLAYFTDKRFTSAIEYSCNENAYDFYYCSDSIVNRARIPMFLNRPQLQDDESVYVKSNGARKLLKSVAKKEYQGQTELLQDPWHDRIKHALSHDNVYIWSRHYEGGISKSSAYEREWPDFLDYEGSIGKFKALATPYNWRNSNCEDCQPFEETPSGGGPGSCNLIITDILIIDGDNSGGGNWKYKAIWTNSAAPNDVVYAYTLDGGLSWQPLTTIINETDNSVDYDLGSVDPLTHIIRIIPVCPNTAQGTGSSAMYQVHAPTGCSVVDHIDIANITNTTADASWPKVTPSPAGGYDYELYQGGSLVTSGNTWNAGATIFQNLAGLTPGRDYLFRVRSHCSDSDVSDWTSVNFSTTAPALPIVTETSNTGTPGSTRTQVFTYTGYAVSDVIPLSIKFEVVVYSHVVVVASDGIKTLDQMIAALVAAVNATTEAQWNEWFTAPAHGTPGFKPTASHVAGTNTITLVLNYGNQFAASCYYA